MRYHLFAGDAYYPEREGDDYRGSFDSQEECIARYQQGFYPGEDWSRPFDWWGVWVERDGNLVKVASSFGNNLGTDPR